MSTPKPSQPIRSIACAVDFSPASHEALLFAARLASRDHAKLTLLHVVPLPVYFLPDAFVPMPPAAVFAADDAARAQLAKWQQEAQQAGAGEVGGFLATGQPAAEVLRWCATEKPDMLVLGQRGLSALEAMLLGSVADRVVRSAHCPVLVVPAKAA